MTESVLPSRIPDARSFRHAVAAYLREDGSRAGKRNGGVWARAHANVLEQTATLVEGLDDDDHALGSLFDAQMNSAGTSTRNTYSPGPRAGKVIGLAGLTPASPSPAELLAEILRATQADVIAAKNEQVRLASDKGEKRIKAEIQAKAEFAIEQAQIGQQRAEAKAAQAEAANAELQKEIKFLKPYAPQDPAPDKVSTPEPEKPKERDRRKSVERGIYATEKADGSTAYEVKIGKHPWQTVGPDLDEARGARDRLLLKSAKAVA